jgi:hypothetical protein
MPKIWLKILTPLAICVKLLLEDVVEKRCFGVLFVLLEDFHTLGRFPRYFDALQDLCWRFPPMVLPLSSP